MNQNPTRIWKVKFYKTARGESPINELVEDQDKTTIDKFVHAVNFLESYGPFLKPPYVKKLQSNLWELRISGKDPLRVFYTVYNSEFYLLHVFKKKSQKTPKQELKVALDRMREII